MKGLGLYIHFPFCRQKCDYCGFYSIPVDDRNHVSLYIDSLCSELIFRADRFRENIIDTIYFGGGTPSLLTPQEFNKIITIIKQNFFISNDCEISIETNPADFDLVKYSEFKKIGVNRFIIGVQTLDAETHKELGRFTPLCTEEILTQFCKMDGVSHAVDLICGVPSLTLEKLAAELELVTGLGVEHLSVYLLTLEDETPLSKRMKESGEFTDHQVESYLLVQEILKKKGYIQYEISNFSLKGYESRHNLKYWNFHSYLGIGAGAHSFIDLKRYYNNSAVMEYIANPIAQRIEDIRSDNMLVVEFILTSLRKISGCSEKIFYEITSKSFPEMLIESAKKEVADGNLVMDSQDNFWNIRLTDQGILFCDGIIERITSDLFNTI